MTQDRTAAEQRTAARGRTATRVRGAVVPVALAGMIALAGVVLGRIYAGPLLAELVAGAAIGSVGASVAIRRLPSWSAAPVSVVLLAAYAVVALTIAAGRADITDPPAEIVRTSLINGIPRLLTALIPVEPTPDTVVVPVVAAWLAGLAAGEVAVRARRVLLGMMPVVALYAGALYVVGPNASPAGRLTLAFAALGIAALAVSARSPSTSLPPSPDVPLPPAAPPSSDTPAAPGGPPSPRAPSSLDGAPSAKIAAGARGRALAGAAAAIAAVLALTAAVGPWVGGQVGATPVDPRRYVQPPQVDSLDESPLNRISGWALAPRQRLFDVTGITKATRLRLAVLPDYDGVTWRVGATYRNAGRVLPAQPRLPDADLVEVRQQIVIEGLTGRLLPAVASPAAVSGARVAYDAATGTLIRPESLTAGVRYDVTSEVQAPDLNLLPTADVPSGDAVARYLSVGPNVPDPIQRLAEQLADGNGAAYDRAVAIEDFIAEHYRKVADAPSGHAYPNLNFFLFGPRNQGGQGGTSEQFAASFALLARLTGLPSRVVVGFDVPAGGGTVTAAGAIAWPEVLFDGLGWVAFDPMPRSKDPRPVEEDFTPKPTKPPPPPSEPPTPSATPSSSGPATVLAAPDAGGSSAAVVAGSASGSVLLILVALAGTIVVLRGRLRRTRLTAGSPDDRITGAWREFTDALRLAGQPVPDHLAATEAAAHAAQSAPPARSRLRKAAPPPAGPLPPLDDLVAGINTVGFAPGAADAGQASRAGAQAVAYADALRRRRSWWRRLWWQVHPGPLRRGRAARIGRADARKQENDIGRRDRMQ